MTFLSKANGEASTLPSSLAVNSLISGTCWGSELSMKDLQFRSPPLPRSPSDWSFTNFQPTRSNMGRCRVKTGGSKLPGESIAALNRHFQLVGPNVKDHRSLLPS